MSKRKSQSRRNLKQNPKTLKQEIKNRSKFAIVKKDISRIVRVGDVLVLNDAGDLYVKQNEHPEMIDSVIRFGFFGMKKTTVSSPNFYTKEHVEHLPSYFQIIIDERQRQEK